MMPENDNLTLLKESYDRSMSKYIETWDDSLLDELNKISSTIANVAIVNQMVAGSTHAITHYSKQQRMQHKDITNFSLEELEKLKLRNELFAKKYPYRDATGILKGVMDGEITPKRGKDLIDLHNLIVTDEIMKKLEELERRI